MMQHGPCGPSPEEHGPEETPVYGGLVHHDGVLLVVTTVASYGHNCIVTCWKFPAHSFQVDIAASSYLRHTLLQHGNSVICEGMHNRRATGAVYNQTGGLPLQISL